MGIEDVRISELVRRVLTRYWVDLTELRFSCTGGTLRFHGTLRRQARPGSPPPPVTESIVDAITQEIRRLPGVKKVYLTGVTVDGRWTEGAPDPAL